MDGLLKMALLLCMVAAGSSVPLPTHPVTSEQFQLITNAIELLNLAAKGSVFRLLLHDVSLDATRSPQQLNFTIKETDCFIREQAEKENREECDFKDGGIVKECSVNFLTDQGIEAPVVNCTTLEQKVILLLKLLWMFHHREADWLSSSFSFVFHFESSGIYCIFFA
ncbi:cathelicidin-related peptide Pt_CRAMP2-like isoform X2 [Lissotriton helveticus]